jgi:hypothetical protein
MKRQGLSLLIVAIPEAPPRPSLGYEIIGDIIIVLRPCGKAKPFRKSGGTAAASKPSPATFGLESRISHP